MAQAKKTKKNQPSTKVAQNLSPLIKEGVMYMLIVLAVYFFICLISFSANDPGWTHTLSSDGISNWGGLMGAFLSDMLLHVFGKMAFIFPILFAVAAFKIYQFRWDEAPRLAPKLLTFAGFLLVIIGGCGLENIHDHGYLDIESWVPGGVLGYAIVSGAGPTFGFIGTTLFLLALLVLGMSWFTGLSWFTVMDYLGKKIYNSYVYVAGKIQEFLDKRAGIKARADREEKVRTIQKKTSSQEPPKIEQRAQTAEPSIRALKEKQQTLFTKQPTQKVKSVAKSKHVSSGDNTIPPLSLLDDAPIQKVGYSTEYLQKLSQLLEKKLLDFNIEARVVGVIPGPVITRFEIDPAPGVKASQITNLSTDLARAMSVISVRVIENIPGKAMVGIEIPNEERETVYMIEGVSSEEYDKNDSPLTILLGKDIAGEAVIADLAKMPHVLIAGTTGSGKSVCVNALIISMLYKSTPEQLRLIMIDPKMLELSIYEGIPHLLAPVVTDMEKAANALRWAIYEMERRYRIMSAMGVRNLSGYNRKIELAIEAGEPLRDPLAENPEEAEELSTLPFIVIVIDELADLMMVIGKKIEELITRIAQKARAAGIHMILATQRPSVDVITGLIKANIPTRIAFQVSSRVDSRTVLDQMGAEQLLGHGDMLYLPPGSGMPMRVHGSFVSDSEVHKIVEYIKENSDANYDDSILETSQVAGEKGATSGFDNGGTDDDPLYDEAVSFVCERQVASISSVQRQLRVGYNRAARLIEQMEEQGVIGAPESGGKRQVLAPPPPKD